MKNIFYTIYSISHSFTRSAFYSIINVIIVTYKIPQNMKFNFLWLHAFKMWILTQYIEHNSHFMKNNLRNFKFIIMNICLKLLKNLYLKDSAK